MDLMDQSFITLLKTRMSLQIWQMTRHMHRELQNYKQAQSLSIGGRLSADQNSGWITRHNRGMR